ncbi:MAG: hypothetical protein QCI82_07895 [Candidatus Thermoplasmatota archaeon]|nr:hypothetical protein [Candidatus Thermoplasmatota archaeon]
MARKDKGTPRSLDLIMSDLNWGGRISYVEDVLYNRDISSRRRQRSFTMIFFLLAFSIGLTSGILMFFILDFLSLI